ncbi:MAG: glycosyltransferase [Acidobacteria bacterium]|nr:glycosyltransferase [Acidobacteriota bacterium]
MANGVDPAKFAALDGDPELRRKLGLEGRKVIGFVGWFRPWHGLEMLVEAYDGSGLAEEGVSVLLVGDGPALPSLRRVVAERGLEGRVVITGAVPHKEIPGYVALFDSAAQPAANEYCCPMKIIEYLASGKPVIAPAQENIRELVEEGVDAALFEAGSVESLSQALRRVMGDEGEMRRLKEGAATAVERRGYLWRRNAERVVAAVAAERR